MLENIVRHIEMGEEPLLASLKGSAEIGFTIVSMTLSLAAVFIPVLFLGGVLGRLFKEFAVTISVAILISGVVSVTLTPMLCSRFLRGRHEEQARLVLPRHGEVLRRHAARLRRHAADGAAPSRAHDAEFRARCWAPRCTCSSRSPRASFPIRTPTSCTVITEAAQGTSYYQMVELRAADRRDRGRQIPNVESLMASVGGATASNAGRPQLRPAGGAPEAAQRAQAGRRRDHQGAAAQARRHSPA